MDALAWLRNWERGAVDYGLGYFLPPKHPEEAREAYVEGNHVAQKAWVAEKRGKL